MITLNDPVVEEILYQGLSDYVALTTIRAMVIAEASAWWHGDDSPDSTAVRQQTLAVCDFVLRNDLMSPGSLSNSTSDPSDFLPWPGTPSQALTRIDRDWDYLTSLDHFEPCWFKSTPEGIRAGEQIDA